MNREKPKGDRIIQIIMLAILVAGFALIALIMKPDSAGPGGGPGGRPGGPNGAPSFGGMGGVGGEPSLVAVEVQEAKRQDVQQFIYVNGDVISNVSVDIFSDVQGELTRLPVTLGRYVQKGELLALVDPSSPGAVYSASEIRATISGTVTAVHAHVGDKVGTSSALLTLGDLNHLSIVTYIPERYFTYMELGLKARVSMAAFPDKSFDAQVVQLNPVMDSTSRSLEIKLELLDPDPRIRAGMFASLQLVTRESRDTLAVPLTAVSRYYDEDVLFVVKDDGSVERRSITLGLASEETVEVLEGISEGERVVTQGAANLAEGSMVKIVNAEENREQ